jgi:hypothetical protein
VLGIVAVCLTLLRAVNPTETDTFGSAAVQDFDGIAVEDGDDGAGEIGSCEGSTQKEKDRGTAAAKTGCCPASQFFVPRYPSRWASMTNCAVVERTASSRV